MNELLERLYAGAQRRRPKKAITIWSYIMADYHTFRDDALLNDLSLILMGQRSRNSQVVRDELRQHDDEICCRCGIDTKTLPKGAYGHTWEADHIIPVAAGGPDNVLNMRTLCIPCHRFVTQIFMHVRKVAVTQKAQMLMLRTLEKLTEKEKVDFLASNQYNEDRDFMPELQCQ